MAFSDLKISVFTKPWKTMPLPKLAAHVKSMGTDGIELPVRPGFQVEPRNAARDLPAAVDILGDHGLQIFSIAADPVPELIAACGDAGVGILRTMPKIEHHETYLSILNKRKRNAS